MLLVICWSIIPTFTTSSYQGNSLLWFVTLYSIAGYIRLYGLNEKFTTKHYFACFLICSLLTYASSVVFVILGNRWSAFTGYITYFYDPEKITILLISLSLFMAFVTLKMNYHKWINVAASATFGVYLIHDHAIVRRLLWIEWFQNSQYQESWILIPYSVMTVIIVYVVCSLVDLLRQYAIEKPFMMVVKSCTKKGKPLFPKTILALKNFIFGK